MNAPHYTFSALNFHPFTGSCPASVPEILHFLRRMQSRFHTVQFFFETLVTRDRNEDHHESEKAHQHADDERLNEPPSFVSV